MSTLRVSTVPLATLTSLCFLACCTGCILTVVLLMQALDADKYLLETTDMLKKLCFVDPCRSAYYQDLCKISSLCSIN